MSKCGICGNEILTGDIHWAIGICNNCYNKLYKSDEQKYVDILHKENSELLVNSLAEKDKQIAELKQQLEEKDEEIAYLTKQVKKFNNEAQKYFEDAYCNDFNNQDKISFAVEQLEKVKEFFLEEHRDEEIDTDYIITKDAGEIADYLLDQIKQLKEMK